MSRSPQNRESCANIQTSFVIRVSERQDVPIAIWADLEFSQMNKPHDLWDDGAPEAYGLLESLRGTGYTPGTAIADIADNSIAAGAKNVWIQFRWNGFGGSWITITDDGNGMTQAELVKAMKLASPSRTEERKKNDLGRFGLGLKTASISLARRFTVSSKIDGNELAHRRWDLDYLANNPGWKMLKNPHEDTPGEETFRRISSPDMSKGTQVLLERLDGILEEGASDQQNRKEFLYQAEEVEKHLRLVFHRFLKKGRPKIHIDGRELKPWDPFLRDNLATQTVDDEMRKDEVKVQGFVMPHASKFSQDNDKDYKEGGLLDGWIEHQGFYVYRGDRLLIPGSWLGLENWQKDVPRQLARISLDLTNSSDDEWQIDVRKSMATPPPQYKEWLSDVALKTRKKARRVYLHRAGALTRRHSPLISYSVWKGMRIDQGHKFIASLKQQMDVSQWKHVKTLLSVIEETLPKNAIYESLQDAPDRTIPFHETPDDQLRDQILTIYEALKDGSSLSTDKIWEQLSGFEAFISERAQTIIAEERNNHD